MPSKLILICVFILSGIVCKAQSKGADTITKVKIDTTQDYNQVLTKLEQQSAEKSYDNLGELVAEIDFQVKTDNLKDYEEGFIPSIGLEHPQKELSKLVGRDEVVISNTSITVIIDYPLTNEYKFKLTSKRGFTRAQLVEAISSEYYKLFAEEEATATIKTIPIDQRKKVANRNQTNGKYGIWGHDIADLVLAGVKLIKASNGELYLVLNIES
jgi:hypothetical protein